MFDRIKAFFVKKYLLGYLVEGYKKLNGNKTQIVMVLAAGVWGAARLGYLSPDQENQAYGLLGGAGSITMLSKLEKWKGMAEELGQEIKKEVPPPVK